MYSPIPNLARSARHCGADPMEKARGRAFAGGGLLSWLGDGCAVSIGDLRAKRSVQIRSGQKGVVEAKCRPLTAKLARYPAAHAERDTGSSPPAGFFGAEPAS